MCVKLEVIVPTVERFLFLYSLRSGCILILIWTIFRSLFCFLFFALAILEILLKQTLPFGALLSQPKEDSSGNSVILVYVLFLTMVITEAFVLMYTFYLSKAIWKEKSSSIATYLISRTLTWQSEVISLILLCVFHKLLIGWYLGFLFFIVLELYAWVIVYSYYCELEEPKEIVCSDTCE